MEEERAPLRKEGRTRVELTIKASKKEGEEDD